MDIYYLCQPDEKPFRPLSNPTGASRVVRPQGSSPKAWARARQKAVEHCAQDHGTRFCMIVVGHVDVRYVQRRDWSKKEYPEVFQPVLPADRHDHGLIVFVERMLSQYAAMVMVPPMGAVRQVRFPWDNHMPVLPMVTAYRVEAAMGVNMASFSPGLELASKGFQTITLGEYGYEQHGPTVYEEKGSAKEWRKAHAETIEELLGVRSRY